MKFNLSSFHYWCSSGWTTDCVCETRRWKLALQLRSVPITIHVRWLNVPSLLSLHHDFSIQSQAPVYTPFRFLIYNFHLSSFRFNVTRAACRKYASNIPHLIQPHTHYRIVSYFSSIYSSLTIKLNLAIHVSAWNWSSFVVVVCCCC